MLKTSFKVFLLYAAQNTFAINLQEEETCDIERPSFIPRSQLGKLIHDEIETGLYNIGEEEG